MYLDKQLEFSDSQAVTATAISTNVIDLGATNTLKDIGNGTPVYLVIQVDTTTASSGSSTCVFSLESDSTANLATSATVHWQSAAIAKATLVAGYQVAVIALPWSKTYERYLGVRYTVAVADFTAGAFSAFLTLDPQAAKSYANNYVN